MALVAGQVPVSGYRIPDYSGAAAAGGAAAAAPYQVASGLIGQVGDYFKQQGEKKKLIKKSDVQIDAALKLFPDLAPTLQGVRDQIRDENVPLDDRAAIADSVAGLINMGTNQMRFQAEQGMQQQRIGLERMQYETAASRAQREFDLKVSEQQQKDYAASAEAIGSLAALKSVEEKTGKKFVPDEIASSVNELAQSGQGQAAANLISKYSAGLDPAIEAEFQSKKAQTPVNINLPQGGTQQMVPNAEGVYEPIKIAGATGPDDAGVLPSMVLPLTATTPDGTPLTVNDIPRGAEKTQEIDIEGKKFDVYVDKNSPLEPVDIYGVYLEGFENAPKEQWTPQKKFLVPKQEEQRQTPVIGPGSIGYAPPKPPSSGFEVTTPEGTTVRYGGSGGLAQPKVGQGQQLIPDPTSPTGTRIISIPGGEAEKAAKQEIVAAEAEKARGIKLGSVALAEIDNFINYTDEMSKLPLASPARKAFAAFGMQEQAEAESSLNTVRSNLKFEALKALREGSPSGASGLGQVTQNEFSALAEQWGDLRLVGDPEKIKERAIRIKKQLLDVIHGDQEHRDALLKSGAISQQQYNEIQSQYPGAKQVSQEDANIQRWRNTFTPQPTQ